MVFIDDLLGVAYKAGGRTKAGYDCYGLVIEVLRRFGFDMSDLFSDYSKEKSEMLIANEYHCVINKDKLVKKEQAEEGDILLFFDDRGRACHIGVYLTSDKFIHCDSLGVRITKFSTYYKKAEVYSWRK